MLNNDIGVIVTVSESWTSYEGTKEELIEDGICTEDQFPEGRKRLKDNWEVRDDTTKHWSMKRIKGSRYCFTQWHPRKELPKDRGSEYASLDAWQSNQEDFVERILMFIEHIVSGEGEKLAHGETTIRFDDSTLKRIKAASHEMGSAIRCGSAVWVGSAKWTKRKLPAAKKDKGFQAFMGSIVGG